jgi:hypothetical protein
MTNPTPRRLEQINFEILHPQTFLSAPTSAPNAQMNCACVASVCFRRRQSNFNVKLLYL